MSRCRFYIDEDAMHSGLLRGLRSQGIDVVSAADSGMRGQEDPDQLALAAFEGRVLLTTNVKDFRVLHARWMAEGRAHSGIVLAYQQRQTVREQIRSVARLASVLSAEEMRNREEFLGNW